MAYEIPVGKATYDVEAGGPYVTAVKGMNQLHKLQLENTMQQLQNKYYGPTQEGKIANQLLENKWYEPKAKSAIALQDAQTGHYPYLNAHTVAQTNQLNTMTPLQAQELQLKNESYPELTKSQIAKNIQTASGVGTGSTATQDLGKFNQQLKIDHPVLPNENQNDYNKRINDIQNAHLKGYTKLPNGKDVPALSGTSEQFLNNALYRNLPTAIKSQLVNYDKLAGDLRHFPINDVASLSGPAGKAKLLYAKANMGLHPNDPKIDPVARRVLTAANQSIAIMDQMRSSWGTSVVPDYVYKTIGRLSNPDSDIWNDATQVKNNFAETVKEVDRTRELLRDKYKHGIAYEKDQEKKPEIYPENIGAGSKEEASVQQVKVNTDGTVNVILPDGTKKSMTLYGAQQLVKEHPNHKIEKLANGK